MFINKVNRFLIKVSVVMFSSLLDMLDKNNYSKFYISTSHIDGRPLPRLLDKDYALYQIEYFKAR